MIKDEKKQPLLDTNSKRLKSVNIELINYTEDESVSIYLLDFSNNQENEEFWSKNEIFSSFTDRLELFLNFFSSINIKNGVCQTDGEIGNSPMVSSSSIKMTHSRSITDYGRDISQTMLDGNYIHFGDQQAGVLANKLKYNSTIKCIRISATEYLRPQGVIALFKMLLVNNTIEIFRINCNKAFNWSSQVELFDIIKDVLTKNRVLKSLKISSASMGVLPAVFIANALKDNNTLKYISFGGHRIENEGAQSFAQTFKVNSTLNHIDLSANQIGSLGVDAIYNSLIVNQNNALRKLTLGYNEKLDDSMIALSSLLCLPSTKLLEVNLEFCQITKSGIFSIQEGLIATRTLSVLKLNGNPIGNEGALIIGEALSSNKSLNLLNLTNCNIGNTGSEALGRMLQVNKKLKGLHLGTNKIDCGARSIFRGLIKNNLIIVLYLDHNKIGNSEMPELNLLLESNSVLMKLDLSNNKILAQGVNHLQKGLGKNKRLRCLHLANNNIMSKGGKYMGNILKENDGIRSINLTYCGIGNTGIGYIISALKKNSSIKQLKISHNVIYKKNKLKLNRIALLQGKFITFEPAYKEERSCYIF